MKDFDINLFNDKNLANHKTSVDNFYEDKDDYEKKLRKLSDKLDALQSMMYAHDRYGLLVIFQAIDAAGKDGTIKAVFEGVNPQGLSFYSFKRPSETELNHDFMWRCFKELPERGKVQVFNRSYYEELLVVKEHPEILTNSQRIPAELVANQEELWQNRYDDIRNFENYLSHNGIKVVKFFLNVSKEEQANRLIERINDPLKNWKFQEGDIKERGLWKEYMQAYQDLINATSTEASPWYVIPADDKKNMRLIVAQILANTLESFKMSYPEPDPARKKMLEGLIETIKQQNLE